MGNYDDEGSGWRDPDISQSKPPTRKQRQTVNVQQQRQQHQQQQMQINFEQVDIVVAPDRQPDDYWVLPPNTSELEILGDNRVNLTQIREKTDAYLVFNARKHQVDIWGDRNSINQAKHWLDQIANPITDKKMPVRTTRKWGKADRELTVPERKREEKRQQRIMEQKSFTGIPSQPQPYNSYLPLKDRTIPLTKFVGEKESILNSIRAACKCFVWYDSSLLSFRIAGQDEVNVRKASNRLRNWHLKLLRKPQPAILKLLYQPSTSLILANFIKLPKEFIPCETDVDPELFDSWRRMETITTGVIDNLRLGHLHSDPTRRQQSQTTDLIDLGDDPSESTSTVVNTTLSEDMQKLNQTNIEEMEEVLEIGLESLRLHEWEIKMDIVFGQIYLIDYPQRGPANPFFSMDELAMKYFPNRQFRSKLAPCIGKTYDHIKDLLGHLSHYGEEYADSPRTSFTIEAMQQPTIQQPETTNRYNNASVSRGPPPSPSKQLEPWRTTLTINNFTSDGFVGLWGCVTDDQKLVSASCANLQGNYSWEVRLQFARRLDNSLDTPHGQFVDKLRLSENKRLIITNVDFYRVHLLKQSTKWVYGWKKNYIVEVEKEEFWNVATMMKTNEKLSSSKLPLDFSTIKPDRVTYNVYLYRESWINRFSENLHLEIGEAPSWTPRHFLNGDDGENLQQLQSDAKEFSDLLSSTVPVYFDKSTVSLV
ncbi:unnamed protein product [Cunninghamella blakesleeana]